MTQTTKFINKQKKKKMWVLRHIYAIIALSPLFQSSLVRGLWNIWVCVWTCTFKWVYAVKVICVLLQGDEFCSLWIGCNEFCFRSKDTAATSSNVTDAESYIGNIELKVFSWWTMMMRFILKCFNAQFLLKAALY